MKRLLYSTAIVMLILFGVSEPSAVNKSQSKQFIHAELMIGKEKISHQFEVPVRSDLTRRPLVDTDFTGGGYAITNGCPKDIGCEYLVILTADALSDGKSILTVNLSFAERDECNASKELTVVRGKRAETKMKCNVRIKAYYRLP